MPARSQDFVCHPGMVVRSSEVPGIWEVENNTLPNPLAFTAVLHIVCEYKMLCWINRVRFWFWSMTPSREALSQRRWRCRVLSMVTVIAIPAGIAGSSSCFQDASPSPPQRLATEAARHRQIFSCEFFPCRTAKSQRLNIIIAYGPSCYVDSPQC